MSEGIEQTSNSDVASNEESSVVYQGLTDDEYSRIRQIVGEVGDTTVETVKTDFESSFDSLDASLAATISDVLPDAIKAASEDQGNSVQTVQLDSGQYQELKQYLDMYQDSLTLQNALLLFTLMFSCALVGMLFFREFSRGFRRG